MKHFLTKLTDLKPLIIKMGQNKNNKKSILERKNLSLFEEEREEMQKQNGNKWQTNLNEKSSKIRSKPRIQDDYSIKVKHKLDEIIRSIKKECGKEGRELKGEWNQVTTDRQTDMKKSKFCQFWQSNQNIFGSHESSQSCWTLIE